ncbi:MAG: DUF1134 domain-containing protein [Chromatiaceae bacterium]|jgi:hypothetical protein
MRNVAVAFMLAVLLTAPAAWAGEEQTTSPQKQTTSHQQSYSQKEILSAVEKFFGQGAEGLGKVVQKVFAEKGEPNAYIAGEEAGGAIVVGLRYGRGTLRMKTGFERKVYWQGPSIGFDFGAAASKVFILVYHLAESEELFQRYPGVEGSLYFVGGVGVNYLQSGKVIIAPIRFGAGWRQGISVGYMDFTREPSANPF